MIRVAVLIPCRNEEVAVPSVIAGFRDALPGARVYVYDNNSTDGTTAAACAAGATVRFEPLQGKGNVVRQHVRRHRGRRLHPGGWRRHLRPGDGARDAAPADRAASRHGHGGARDRGCHRLSPGPPVRQPHADLDRAQPVRQPGLGHAVRLPRLLAPVRQILPALSTGFETETEFTVHALELAMPVGEVQAPYKDRPAGSVSKLRTYADGLRILRTIVLLVKEVRPLQFFFAGALVLGLMSLSLGGPIVATFIKTGLVPRLPTAVLAAALMGLASLAATCGLILDSVARGRKEQKRMAYLAIPAIGVDQRSS
ncbi:MAG: glycosyl transferase family 2 [Acetobacteraceae bacterium]